MNSFGNYLKRARTAAYLTQAQVAEKLDVSIISVQNWENGKNKISDSNLNQLAYIYNVPIDTLIKEKLKEQDKMRSVNWPQFLFDESTNSIVSSLHLNLAQQELFGLLYLYDAEYLKNKMMDSSTLKDDLKRVPYAFINKVGSIQFLNIAEGLQKVLRYVQTDFLLKVLKLNPAEEFDVCRLSKLLICEFIDSGHKKPDEFEIDAYAFNPLDFHINMHKARIVLPILEKSEIHLTDGRWSNPLREDVPPKIAELGSNPLMIRYGLEEVTDYYAVKEPDTLDQWIWKINEKGKTLLKWFNDNEKEAL